MTTLIKKMMQTKKSLGQNFLRDPKILKKIADFAQIKNTDTVVEIGPGEGTLTKFLLERAERVIAIEKDENLAEILKEKFKKEIAENRLEIIEGDILNFESKKSSVNEPCERDWRDPPDTPSRRAGHEEFSSKKISVRENRSFFLAKKYILVGNIPYYITGALFKKFLEAENKPESITFVVQKEVAERIMARDNKESILSISIKAYGQPVFGGVIKAGNFFPKPKVDSAILAVRNIGKTKEAEQKSSCSESPRISSLHSARLSSQDFFAQLPYNFEKRFFEILKTGFAHKRKLLIKNLLNMSKTRLDTLELKEIFEKCGISEKARAENLKVSDWICLTKEL